MEYDFYEVVKVVMKKIQLSTMKGASLNLSRLIATSNNLTKEEKSNISDLKSSISNSSYNTQGGFEDVLCGWADVLELTKDIKSIRKKQIIGYKALGYDNWEIAEIMGTYERKIDRDIYKIKSFFKKSVGKSE